MHPNVTDVILVIMQQYPFWDRQSPQKPLFPDVEWNKPEQRSRAGKLGIVGGNKLNFSVIADSYSTALKTGSGEVKILLPDALKKSIPSAITEATFAPSNISGGLSREALADLQAIGDWATGLVFIGDAGRSSETSIVYEDFLSNHSGWVTLTRDAVDLVSASNHTLVDRDKTLFVLSFAQLQKLFSSVYYPKVITFSMQLANLVECLHKFTITYPVTLVTLHKDHLLVAHGGRVVTMEWDKPMDIWRGKTATNAATYLLWNETKPLEAISASTLT